MNCCGELPCEGVCGSGELAGRVGIGVAENKEGCGAEDLLREGGIGEQGSGCGFPECMFGRETACARKSGGGLERGAVPDGLAEVAGDAFAEALPNVLPFEMDLSMADCIAAGSTELWGDSRDNP